MIVHRIDSRKREDETICFYDCNMESFTCNLNEDCPFYQDKQDA